MTDEFLSIASASPARSPVHGRTLSEKDAVEIWIARWLRIPVKVLLARYGCDSTRLYEIWWGDRFPAARSRAAEEFRRRYPQLADRTVFGYRRIPRHPSAPSTTQPDLFG